MLKINVQSKTIKNWLTCKKTCHNHTQAMSLRNVPIPFAFVIFIRFFFIFLAIRVWINNIPHLPERNIRNLFWYPIGVCINIKICNQSFFQRNKRQSMLVIYKLGRITWLTRIGLRHVSNDAFVQFTNFHGLWFLIHWIEMVIGGLRV